KWKCLYGNSLFSFLFDCFYGGNFGSCDSYFIHCAVISLSQTGARPIATNPLPEGVPAWGAEFKKASIDNYGKQIGIGGQGASMPHKNNYLTLDDTYKDAYGLPLLQMNYNFTEQDKNLQA